MPADDVLVIWTIYNRPRDYPHGFIARKFEIGPNAEPLATLDILTGSLSQIRAQLTAKLLVPIPRQQADEPQIVESWI